MASQQQVNELQARVEALAAQNQALMNTIAGFQEQQQTAANAMTQVTAAIAGLPAQLATALQREPRRTFIDVRGLGKPSVFNNEEKSFGVWARKREIYVVGVYPDLRSILPWCCEQDQPVAAAQVQAEGVITLSDIGQVK